MTKILHKISPKAKSIIAAALSLIMVFGIVAVISPVEAQAISVGATDTGFYNLAYGANGETTFGVGSQIRVINQTRENKNKSDAVYKFDGTLNWEPADPADYVVWEGFTENIFYGVYPSDADYDKFTIPTDQSGGVQVADWMTDDFTANKSMGKVQFEFQHRLAKVTVNITKWNDEFNGVPQTIKYPKIRSTCQSVEITYGTGDNGTNRYLFRGNSPFIDPAINGDSYTAIVAPDRYISTQKFMSFSINGQDFNVLAGDNKVLTDGLQPGMHYTFNLTVGKDAVTIESVSVTKWDEQDINGGVAKECEHNFVNCICTLCGTEAYTYDSSVNTYYVYYGAGLQPAVTEASASGTADSPATVKLMNDMTVGTNGWGSNNYPYSVRVASGNVILDLNNCVLTTNAEASGVDIANGSKLTIVDSSTDKGGKITGTSAFCINNFGELVVYDGTFESLYYSATYNEMAIRQQKLLSSTNEVSATINGGSFLSKGFAVSVNANTYITINGGYFKGENTAISTGQYVNVQISGGTFSGDNADIQSHVQNILCFDEVTGNGPSFPGGITVNLQYSDSKSLSELLATGAAYYNVDGELITLEAGATSIDGDVTVKKAE